MADRACMALIDDGHILLVRQTYRGKTFWTFPGGGIEIGETPKDAAIREVKEEVNLETKVIRLLHQQPRVTGKGIYYCYLGQISKGTLSLGHDPELQAVQWFPIQTVKNHPEVARVLEQVND